MFRVLLEDILNHMNESVCYSGVKALYNVYHDVERDIDPDPVEIFTALDMMKIHSEEFLKWYDKYAKNTNAQGIKKYYTAFNNRLLEIEKALASHDKGEMLVALDTMVDEWHIFTKVWIAGLSLEVKSGRAMEKGWNEISKWVNEVNVVLNKLDRGCW